MKIIDDATKYIKLLRKYNTLKANYEILKEYVKEDAFNKLIDKLGEPDRIAYLIETYKKQRIKIKELKEELKNK